MQAKWYGLVSAAVFVIITTYMRVKFVFDSGRLAGALLAVSIVLAILTFVFALLSLPRWQGWTALIISGYAFYLLVFTRLYGID
jgi:hypothetical protein